MSTAYDVHSSADDVREMKWLCEEIATRLTRTGQVKDRIAAILDVFSLKKRPLITENRASEFLRGRAHKIESWEKDHAREALATLKRAERERKDAEHLDWLSHQIGRLEASGEELHGPHVDALQHLFRVARGEAGAVALPQDQDDMA